MVPPYRFAPGQAVHVPRALLPAPRGACDRMPKDIKDVTDKYGKPPALYSDFRKMLDEVKEIDAVTVSTPDHAHYPAAMHAIALGKQLGAGARVATILCDTGFRYLSSLFNAEWLEAKGLPVFPWLRQG